MTSGMEALLRWFKYAHLKPEQQKVSKPFGDFAHELTHGMGLDGPEAEEGLRKLLEAKDCFVRASFITPPPPPRDVPTVTPDEQNRAMAERSVQNRDVLAHHGLGHK